MARQANARGAPRHRLLEGQLDFDVAVVCRSNPRSKTTTFPGGERSARVAVQRAAAGDRVQLASPASGERAARAGAGRAVLDRLSAAPGRSGAGIELRDVGRQRSGPPPSGRSGWRNSYTRSRRAARRRQAAQPARSSRSRRRPARLRARSAAAAGRDVARRHGTKPASKNARTTDPATATAIALVAGPVRCRWRAASRTASRGGERQARGADAGEAGRSAAGARNTRPATSSGGAAERSSASGPAEVGSGT